jgi:hypothetical protein
MNPNPLNLMGWEIFEDQEPSPGSAFSVECPLGFPQIDFLQSLSMPFLSANRVEREWIFGNHDALELGSFTERKRKENRLTA